MDVRPGETIALAAARIQRDLDEGHYELDDVAPLAARQSHNTNRVHMKGPVVRASQPIPAGTLLAVRSGHGRGHGRGRGWGHGRRGYRPFFRRRRHHRHHHPLWWRLPVLSLLGRPRHNVERAWLTDRTTGESRELLVAARRIPTGAMLSLRGKKKRELGDDPNPADSKKRKVSGGDDDDSILLDDDERSADEEGNESDDGFVVESDDSMDVDDDDMKRDEEGNLLNDPKIYVPQLLVTNPSELKIENTRFETLFSVSEGMELSRFTEGHFIADNIRAAAGIGLLHGSTFDVLQFEPAKIVLHHDPLVGLTYAQLYRPSKLHEGVLLPEKDTYFREYVAFLDKSASIAKFDPFRRYLEPMSLFTERAAHGLGKQPAGLPPRDNQFYRDLDDAPDLVTAFVDTHIQKLRDAGWGTLLDAVDATELDAAELFEWEDIDSMRAESNAKIDALKELANDSGENLKPLDESPRDRHSLGETIVFERAFDALVNGTTDARGNVIQEGTKDTLFVNLRKLANNAARDARQLTALAALYMYVCPPADFSSKTAYAFENFSKRRDRLDQQHFQAAFRGKEFRYRGANAIADVMATALLDEWLLHAQQTPYGLLADTVRQLSVIRWVRSVIKQQYSNVPVGVPVENKKLYEYALDLATRSVLDELVQRILMLALSPELDLADAKEIYAPAPRYETADSVVVLEVPDAYDPNGVQLEISLSDALARQLVTQRPLRRVQVSVGLIEEEYLTVQPILKALRASAQALNVYVPRDQELPQRAGSDILGAAGDTPWVQLTALTVTPEPESINSYYDLHKDFKKTEKMQAANDLPKGNEEEEKDQGQLLTREDEIEISLEEEEMGVDLDEAPADNASQGYDMRWFENFVDYATPARFPALTTLAVLPAREEADTLTSPAINFGSSELAKQLTRVLFTGDAVGQLRPEQLNEDTLHTLAVADTDYLKQLVMKKTLKTSVFRTLTTLILPDAYLPLDMTYKKALTWWGKRTTVEDPLLWSANTAPALIHHVACHRLRKLKALTHVHTLVAHYSPFLFNSPKDVPVLHTYLLPSSAEPSNANGDTAMISAFERLVRPGFDKNGANDDYPFRAPMDYFARCKTLKVLALYSSHYTGLAKGNRAMWERLKKETPIVPIKDLQTVVLSLESIGDKTTMTNLEMYLPELPAGQEYVPIAPSIDPSYDVKAASKTYFVDWLKGNKDMPLRSFVHYCRVDVSRANDAFGGSEERKFLIKPDTRNSTARAAYLYEPTSDLRVKLAAAGLQAPRMRDWLMQELGISLGEWPAFGEQIAFQWAEQEAVGMYRRVFDILPTAGKTRQGNMPLASTSISDDAPPSPYLQIFYPALAAPPAQGNASGVCGEKKSGQCAPTPPPLKRKRKRPNPTPSASLVTPSSSSTPSASPVASSSSSGTPPQKRKRVTPTPIPNPLSPSLAIPTPIVTAQQPSPARTTPAPATSSPSLAIPTPIVPAQPPKKKKKRVSFVRIDVSESSSSSSSSSARFKQAQPVTPIAPPRVPTGGLVEMVLQADSLVRIIFEKLNSYSITVPAETSSSLLPKDAIGYLAKVIQSFLETTSQAIEVADQPSMQQPGLILQAIQTITSSITTVYSLSIPSVLAPTMAVPIKVIPWAIAQLTAINNQLSYE